MEEIRKDLSCCFTGHRPEKLNLSEREVRARLESAIKDAIAKGFCIFYTGMARGVDMWAAEAVLKEREKDPRIKLICASPYKNFETRWSFSEQHRYVSILKKADEVVYVCEHYSKACFQIRNCYIVDRASCVIAAYNGESGGTRNTIRYAMQKGVEIVNILEDTL